MSTGYPTRDTGVVSIQDLRRCGLTRAEIDAALGLGSLSRIRRGWYSRAVHDADAVEAVYLGGALTSVSTTSLLGLWTFDDGLLHVAVPGNASRLRLGRNADGDPVDRRGRSICLHWGRADGPFTTAVAPMDRVLLDVGRCQPADHVVAIADSALNRGLLTTTEVRACVPQLADLCDGASQAGTESLVRLRLRRRGIRVRTQVWIGDVGAVDLLVGDRLVIECDSHRYHDGYRSARDYDRDLALVALGYIVVRLRYDHVMDHWERAERAILQVVRERRHVRRGGASGAHLMFAEARSPQYTGSTGRPASVAQIPTTGPQIQ